MTNRRLIFWTLLAAALLLFVFLIRSILLPFVLGILIAYLLDPATDRLEKKLSRGIATSVMTAVFFTAFGLLLLLIVPVVAGQLSGLITALPDYISDFEQQYEPRVSAWIGGLPAAQMDSVKNAVADFSGSMAKLFADFMGGLLQSGIAFFNLLSLILITPVVTFYLLRDWDHLTQKIDMLLPRAHIDTIRHQLSIIDATLAGFLRGQLNVCAALATYYALALSIAGLKFSIVIGICAGFLVILPYVGFFFSLLVGMAVAFFQFDDQAHILCVFVVFMVGQVLESYFLTPKLVGEKVGLHPVWIIFGMLAGGALFGFVGVLLSIPVSAVIGVLTRFALAQYIKSEYYTGAAKPSGK